MSKERHVGPNGIPEMDNKDCISNERLVVELV